MSIKKFFKPTNKLALYRLIFGVAVLLAGGLIWWNWSITLKKFNTEFQTQTVSKINKSNLDIQNIFLNAPIINSKANDIEIFEESLFKRKMDIYQRPGKWIRNRNNTMLIFLNLLDTVHAEGLYQSYLVVIDPFSKKRLTPVFHYISDEADFRILEGFNRNILVYMGRKIETGIYTDSSLILAFENENVQTKPILKDEKKSNFPFIEKNDFYLYKLVYECPDELRPSMCDAKFQQPRKLLWNTEKEIFYFE